MLFKEAFANKASLFKTKRNKIIDKKRRRERKREKEKKDKLEKEKRENSREKDIKISYRYDISLRFASVKVIFAL